MVVIIERPIGATGIGAVSLVITMGAIGATIMMCVTMVRLATVPYGFTQHRGRIFVNGGIHATGGTLVRVMPRCIFRRCRNSVTVVRVVVMPVVPRGGSPVRHITPCRKCSNAEYGGTGCRITIHRATIRIPVYREPVHVVAGIRPCYG